MSQLPLEAEEKQEAVDAEIADEGHKALVSTRQASRPLTFKGGVEFLPPAEMREVAEEWYARKKAFRDWIMSKLVRGVHYGFPPGCEPDTSIDPDQWKARAMLYKAGAQFLADLCDLDPRFEADMPAWEQGGKVAGSHYRHCTLTDRRTGEAVGEGYGMGQVGQKRRDGNAAIKVGDKCALSDAILNTLGLADLFTQDGPPGTEEGTPAKSAAASRTGKKPPNTDTSNAVKAINALYGAWCMAANLDTQDKKAKEGFGAWAESILQRSVPPATEITVTETGVLAAWFKANGVAKKVNE
ncbi:MAG TPA: hypothetical protein VNA25_08150 [Phycisphaerae bacterium]|nr:hypothetical protein [Phycisphaerae bacterium]